MATGSVEKSSDLVEDYCCAPCEEKHIKESAEFFCITCTKLFCGKCINLHSQLYEKHSSFGRGDMNKWPLCKKTEDFLQICEIHKDENLQMFCRGHNQLCCTNCVLLSHRRCKEVTLLSETVKSQSTDLQQFADKIKTAIEDLNQLQSTREGNINYVDYSFSELLQEVRDVRQKLNAGLDKLEKMTIKELEDRRTALQASLKTDVDHCHRLKDELKQLSEAVLDLFDKSKEELSFIAGRKCMDKIRESKTYLKEKIVKIDCSIMFQANTEIDKFLGKQLGLGRFVDVSKSLALQLNPDKVIKLKRMSEHDVHISSDSNQIGKITGICSLPSGQIVIADQFNKRMKLLDQQYNVISHCDVSHNLWDICHITGNEVAATVRDSQTSSVQFISVCNGQLVDNRKVQFQHNIFGIAHHQGALYVTSPTALYHYTLTGTLVKKMYEDVSADTVRKCAVSSTGDRIYVTNYRQHKLLTLDTDGTLISTFTDPKLCHPWDVHVTPAGQVVVCWFSENTIIQVDRDGRRQLGTLATTNNVGYPLLVCYNSNRNSMIVVMLNINKTTLLVLEVH